MNDDKNVTVAPTASITTSANDYSLTRAKSFKVTTPIQNYAQYIRTVKAYALAGMPFEHIANAGDLLEDQVERGEIDASLIEGLQGKAGEIAEDESKLLAWQNRGERISISHQLPTPTATTDQELVPISQELTTVEPSSEKTLDVIEGIGVFNQNPAGQLDNNPYLKPIPPEIKKIS